jgi:transcriptional regulator GlxA family with amidase domain
MCQVRAAHNRSRQDWRSIDAMKMGERLKSEARAAKHHRLGIIAYDGASLLNIAGPCETFFWANRELQQGQGQDGGRVGDYEVVLLSQDGGVVRTSCGVDVVTQPLPSADDAMLDTVAIVGGMGVGMLGEGDPLIAWLRAFGSSERRIASFGSGVFALAQAGLLDDRSCAAHWRIADVLRDRFPKIRIETGALFVCDGNRVTAAGLSASMDLALKMIEGDFGQAVAVSVARVMVVSRIRTGEQPQISAELRAQIAATPKIAAAAEWIVNNIDARPTVAAIAERFAMSERNFSRLFTRETGFSPRRYLELVRIEAARRWLTGSRLPIEKVALHCGFSGGETMAYSFKKIMGMTPGDYRERIHADASDL